MKWTSGLHTTAARPSENSLTTSRLLHSDASNSSDTGRTWNRMMRQELNIRQWKFHPLVYRSDSVQRTDYIANDHIVHSSLRVPITKTVVSYRYLDSKYHAKCKFASKFIQIVDLTITNYFHLKLYKMPTLPNFLCYRKTRIMTHRDRTCGTGTGTRMGHCILC